jgi:hypothetical protein
VVEARAKEARERAARIRHAFSTVAETFIAGKLAQERRGKRAEQDLRSVFIPAWADRPISEITTLDVLEIIRKKDEGEGRQGARTFGAAEHDRAGDHRITAALPTVLVQS